VDAGCRIETGDKFTSSLSDSGELVLLINDFSLADVGEYKVIVENELGAVSQIIRMEMAGKYRLLALSSAPRVIFLSSIIWCIET